MVTLRDITIGYGARVLASGLCAEFAVGTLTAVVGRNGAGKSTLLRVVAGLAAPLSGEVIFRENGDDAADLSRLVAFVSTEHIRVLGLRVRDLVALGRTPYTGWTGCLGPEDKAIVNEAITTVGMNAFASALVDTLSDGEAQRVMIARALAQDTPVIVLDEPTAFLDYHARREVVALLAELAHERSKTIVFSSHELDLVERFADKKVEL